MAIEITEFADVSISVSPTGVSGGNFGILGFLGKASDDAKNPISTAERGRAYTSLASVLGDWNTTSEVYKAAAAFYGQTPTPTDFVALMNYDTATSAELIGGAHEELDDILALTNSPLTLTIDGTEVAIAAVDFTGDTTLADVAATIDTEVAAVVVGSTCVYGAYGFELRGNVTGSSGTITFATGDLAEALGFAQHQALISNGLDVETPVQSLSEAVVKGIDFVGLVIDKDFRDVQAGAEGTNAFDIATWAEGAKKIFCNTSNQLSIISPLTTDVFSELKAGTFRFTLNTFSKNPSQYPSASVFGRAASVNFSSVDSTITLNLKQMPGVTAEDLTPAEFAHLRSKFGSAVVQIGKTANAYTDSRMASGSWLDTTHGLLWLENRAEVDMFNLMYQSPTKVPFTQTGINITKGTLDRSLQAAVLNGLCGPGFLSDGTYLSEGYEIIAVPLAQVPSSDKGNRAYKGLSFRMVGAGAMHEVEVSGSFSE